MSIVVRRRSRKRGLIVGAAVLAVGGAAVLAVMLLDDGGDGRSAGPAREAQPVAEGDDQPAAPPAAAGEAPATASPAVEKHKPFATPGTATPVDAPAPLPAASNPPPVAATVSLATKEPVSHQGHASPARPTTRPGAAAPAHPDGGASAAAQPSSPDGGARPAQTKLASSKGDLDSGSVAEDERADFVRVARFAPNGGNLLQGRVVDADSGRPVVGTVVEAVLAERFMESRTDSTGAFQMRGMLPSTRVRIWIGGKHDPFVAERIDVGIPGEGQVADAGIIRLLRGDELSGRLDGWVGLFVARRGGRVLASAVSPWLPADRAGIQVGDVLVSIDGRDVEGFGPRAAAFLLRGAPKSTVTLVIESHDGGRRKLALERVVR